MTPKEARGILRRVAVKHTPQEMEAELNTIVDNGCTVIDVIVDHPIYGQLTGPLQISNRYEVSQFIERCKKAEPLSSLTDGIHLHTLSCPDEAAFERTKSARAHARPAGGKRKLRVDNPHTSDYSVICICQDTYI